VVAGFVGVGVTAGLVGVVAGLVGVVGVVGVAGAPIGRGVAGVIWRGFAGCAKADVAPSTTRPARVARETSLTWLLEP
jgi:hypothetical protein